MRIAHEPETLLEGSRRRVSITPGMLNHYHRLCADNVFHRCTGCELQIGRYPGRNCRYCPNCGADLKGQDGYPCRAVEKVAPRDYIGDRLEDLPMSKRESLLSWVNEVCNQVHAKGNLPMVPWSPNHRVVNLETVDGTNAILGVYCPSPKLEGRLVKVLRVPLLGLDEGTLSDLVLPIVSRLMEKVGRPGWKTLLEYDDLTHQGVRGLPANAGPPAPTISLANGVGANMEDGPAFGASSPGRPSDTSPTLATVEDEGLKEFVEKLPSDADWFSPDGGTFRIWMRSASSGVVFFWFRGGKWTRQDFPASEVPPGEQISASHPKVREIKARFFLGEAKKVSCSNCGAPVKKSDSRGTESRPVCRKCDADVQGATPQPRDWRTHESTSTLREVSGIKPSDVRKGDTLRLKHTKGWTTSGITDPNYQRPDDVATVTKIVKFKTGKTTFYMKHQDGWGFMLSVAGDEWDSKNFAAVLKESLSEDATKADAAKAYMQLGNPQWATQMSQIDMELAFQYMVFKGKAQTAKEIEDVLRDRFKLNNVDIQGLTITARRGIFMGAAESVEGKEGDYQYICAWCQAKYGKSSIPDSHGICPTCAKKLMAQIQKKANQLAGAKQEAVSNKAMELAMSLIGLAFSGHSKFDSVLDQVKNSPLRGEVAKITGDIVKDLSQSPSNPRVAADLQRFMEGHHASRGDKYYSASEIARKSRQKRLLARWSGELPEIPLVEPRGYTQITWRQVFDLASSLGLHPEMKEGILYVDDKETGDRVILYKAKEAWYYLKSVSEASEVAHTTNPTLVGVPIMAKDKGPDEWEEEFAESLEVDTTPGDMGSRKYHVACGVVIKDRSDVLLGRSVSEDDRNGLWCFPGGHIDPEDGADPLAAAVRETFEESGIVARPTGDIIDHPEKPGVAFVVMEYVSGTPRNTSEFSEFIWVPAAAIDDVPCIYPTNSSIVHLLPSSISGGLSEAGTGANFGGPPLFGGGSAPANPKAKPGTTMQTPEKQKPIDGDIKGDDAGKALSTPGDKQGQEDAVDREKGEEEGEDGEGGGPPAAPQPQAKEILLLLPGKEAAEKASDWLKALGIQKVGLDGSKVRTQVSSQEELLLVQRTASAFGLEVSSINLPL